MIDNFKKIRGLLRFDKPNDYYLIEVMKRRKDNPRLPVESKFIKELLVYSLKDFDDGRDEILCACEVLRARAYIWLNARNAEVTGFHCLKRLSSLLMEKNYTNIYGLFRKVSEEVHFDKHPKYLIDLDFNSDLTLVESTVRANWSDQLNDQQLFELIRTPHGFHAVTYPFDTKKFRDVFPHLMVYTDRPTILYAPLYTQEDSDTKTC